MIKIGVCLVNLHSERAHFISRTIFSLDLDGGLEAKRTETWVLEVEEAGGAEDWTLEDEGQEGVRLEIWVSE